MVTELVNNILQNKWLFATDYKYVYISKTLFALNAFDLLTGHQNIPEILEKLKIFSFVSMVTV